MPPSRACNIELGEKHLEPSAKIQLPRENKAIHDKLHLRKTQVNKQDRTNQQGTLKGNRIADEGYTGEAEKAKRKGTAKGEGQGDSIMKRAPHQSSPSKRNPRNESSEPSEKEASPPSRRTGVPGRVDSLENDVGPER